MSSRKDHNCFVCCYDVICGESVMRHHYYEVHFIDCMHWTWFISVCWEMMTSPVSAQSENFSPYVLAFTIMLSICACDVQSSIKFTAEPPQGVKAGLKRTYGIITQDQLDISNMPQWKPLLYSVAFLHTTVQVTERHFAVIVYLLHLWLSFLSWMDCRNINHTVGDLLLHRRFAALNGQRVLLRRLCLVMTVQGGPKK